MSYVRSFPPIESAAARVLILGTMPGIVSLRENQYYAHPQNAFWRIAGAILGFDAASPYAVRVALLRAAGIAVWDVLKSCTRQGSLDSDIVHATAVPNDLPAFLGGIRRSARSALTAPRPRPFTRDTSAASRGRRRHPLCPPAVHQPGECVGAGRKEAPCMAGDRVVRSFHAPLLTPRPFRWLGKGVLRQR